MYINIQHNIIKSVLPTMSEIPNKTQELLNSANDIMENLGYESFKSMCGNSKIVHEEIIQYNKVAQCLNCTNHKELIKCCQDNKITDTILILDGYKCDNGSYKGSCAYAKCTNITFDEGKIIKKKTETAWSDRHGDIHIW